MRVLVTGGTGGLGRKVVRLLRDEGHDVLVGTRSPRSGDEVEFDLAGSVPDLRGVDTVVHLASQPRSIRLEVEGSQRLFESAAAAGVGHIVFMSIVGIDGHPFPYYRAKVGVEDALTRSGVPWTIFRSTQFHGFIPRLTDGMARFGMVMVPSGIAVQPIDPDTVARRIVELVDAGPCGRVPDLGGPEVLALDGMARDYLRATGRHTPVISVPIGGAIVRAFRAGHHHTPNRDRRGLTYREWLGSLAERNDPATGLLRLSGAMLMATVVFMLFAPGAFHDHVAGFGALNTHFIRDAATFGVPMALALWMAASRKAWRRPVLALGLIQNGLHIVNHIVDVANAVPGWHGPVNLALLVGFELVMWMAWRADARVASSEVPVEVAA